MSKCEVLKYIQNRIATGTPPEYAIPMSIPCTDPDDAIELYYYCVQVLPEGNRKEYCRQRLEELTNAIRTDQRGQ